MSHKHCITGSHQEDSSVKSFLSRNVSFACASARYFMTNADAVGGDRATEIIKRVVTSNSLANFYEESSNSLRFSFKTFSKYSKIKLLLLM